MDTALFTPFKRQLSRFIIVGCAAVATDFIFYFFLISSITHTPAKTISFIAGTIVAYIFNKYWTFKRPKRSHAEIFQFFILYTITLGVNVGVNTAILYLFPKYTLIAFFFATGTSTVLNFIGQKWWVFKNEIT